MRFSTRTLSLALLLTFVSVGCVFSTAIADSPTADASTAKIFTKSYRLADMPVWTEGGTTFNPAILVAYLKSSVKPSDWNADSRMAPYPKQKCLVVSTTAANHDSIAEVLESLRTDIKVRQ